MINNQIIEKWKVVCYDHPTEIQISKKRKNKYYKINKPLPKKYQNEKYHFDKKGFLVDIFGNKVIKNIKSADKPNIQSLNSNSLYGGNMHYSTRSKIVNYLHTFFFEKMEKQLPKKITLENDEKLYIFLTHFVSLQKYKDTDWDNLNYFYLKTIQDNLGEGDSFHKLGIIKDDNLSFITGGGAEFINSEEKKLEITLIKTKKDFRLPYLL